MTSLRWNASANSKIREILADSLAEFLKCVGNPKEKVWCGFTPVSAILSTEKSMATRGMSSQDSHK